MAIRGKYVRLTKRKHGKSGQHHKAKASGPSVAKRDALLGFMRGGGRF